MKCIPILILSFCIAFAGNAQTYRIEPDIIAPAPSIINLNVEPSTEYIAGTTITLKAGFEVSQNGNTNAVKYFRAYISEYKPVDVSYAILNKDLNAGFATTVNKILYFIYDEKYNTGTLNYKIYDYARNPISAPVLTKTVVGRNYFQVNMGAIPGLTLASDEQKYFTLEVTNAKNEVFVLRFRYILMP